jgi:hypothetical protein
MRGRLLLRVICAVGTAEVTLSRYAEDVWEDASDIDFDDVARMLTGTGSAGSACGSGSGGSGGSGCSTHHHVLPTPAPPPPPPTPLPTPAPTTYFEEPGVDFVTNSPGFAILCVAIIVMVAALVVYRKQRAARRRAKAQALQQQSWANSGLGGAALTGGAAPTARPVPPAARPFTPMAMPVPPVSMPGGGRSLWLPKTGASYSEKSRFITDL